MKQAWLMMFFFVGAVVFSQAAPDPALSLLSASTRDALLKDGEVTMFGARYEDLSLGKGSPFQEAADKLFLHRDSTLAAEALFLIPAPLPPPGAARDALFKKAMTSVSTMKNLQVYSVSLKRMETFIFDAYRTSSLDKKTRLGDPEISPQTMETSFTMYQNEEQTGESFALYTFRQTPKWYEANLTNLTSLKYGILPLVSPKDLLTAVYVVPLDGKVLVYGVSVAKTLSLFGLERSKTSSLYLRMKALVLWFTNNLRGTTP